MEGSTSLPDWMVDQDREVLTVSLVSALASWTGSNRERQGAPAFLQHVEGEKLKYGAGLEQVLEGSGCPGY